MKRRSRGANHGADATGVDISPRQIELAKQKANDAGLSVRFLAADVYALPDSLDDGSFDIVVTGGGALMWLPDLQRWAEIVANLLKPGGRLILYEMHPLAGCLEVEDGQLKLGDDYFGRKKPLVYTGWTHFPGAENTPETKYEFAWPLGDVVTSVVQAGLRLESLEEFPNDAEWKFHDMLDEVKRLPGSFLLVASKERAFVVSTLPEEHMTPAGRQEALAYLSEFVERARRMQGWTFDEVKKEQVGPGPAWNYGARARKLTLGARSVLDIGTGGGEAFSAICEGYEGFGLATEAWPPNVQVAAKRLSPMGIRVVHASGSNLPFSTGSLDVVS